MNSSCSSICSVNNAAGKRAEGAIRSSTARVAVVTTIAKPSTLPVMESSFGGASPKASHCDSSSSSEGSFKEQSSKPPKAASVFLDAPSRLMIPPEVAARLEREQREREEEGLQSQASCSSINTLRSQVLGSTGTAFVEGFSWHKHCARAAEIRDAAAAAAVCGVLMCSVAQWQPVQPWCWIDGVRVEIESTPPGTPPSCPPQPREPHPETQQQLWEALEREKQLQREVQYLKAAALSSPDPSCFSDNSATSSVQEMPLAMGKPHVDVPLTTLGPCAVVVLSDGSRIDLPIETKEGDWLLCGPPRNDVTPVQFTLLQLKEYAVERNRCLVAGCVYYWLRYPCIRSLPQKAGAQKGAGFHFLVLGFFIFLFAVVLFSARGQPVLHGCFALSGAFASAALGLCLYRRGRTKKQRFLGKDSPERAANRSSRKTRR